MLAKAAHLAGRSLLTGLVRRLPAAAAAALRRPTKGSRRPSRLRRMVQEVLRRGGLPAAARTFTLPDNPSLRFVNADSLVVQQLYWFGEQGWEPELLPWWRQACRRATKIVELGANVGYFAVQGGRAAPGVRYLAVEPHPASVQACRENLALNGIGSVEVLAAAATADPARSRVELVIPWEQLGAPTVAFLPGGSELPASMADRAATTIAVPAVDVRSLLDGVDVLKVDVEGQEHTLLSAGWPQLRAHRPAIFVEVLPGTRQLRGLLAQLCTDLGYRCFAPRPDRLVPVPVSRLPTIDLWREHRTNDVVLYPP
jgi:FkbM family methyltransferase